LVDSIYEFRIFPTNSFGTGYTRYHQKKAFVDDNDIDFSRLGQTFYLQERIFTGSVFGSKCGINLMQKSLFKLSQK
jgi:hypothetical protein